MSTLVTVDISIRVTVPVYAINDPDRAMDDAEKLVNLAMPDVTKALKDWSVDDVVINEVYAKESEAM